MVRWSLLALLVVSNVAFANTPRRAIFTTSDNDPKCIQDLMNLQHMVYTGSLAPTAERLQGQWRETFSIEQPLTYLDTSQFFCASFPEGSEPAATVLKFEARSASGLRVSNDGGRTFSEIKPVSFNPATTEFNLMDATVQAGRQHALIHYCTVVEPPRIDHTALFCKTHFYNYTVKNGKKTRGIHTYGVSIYQKLD